MSDSKRLESPSQSSSVGETPKTKKVRQKRGGKASKSESLTPIGKYLIKEEPGDSQSTKIGSSEITDSTNPSTSNTSTTQSARNAQQQSDRETRRSESKPVNPSAKQPLSVGEQRGGKKTVETGVKVAVKKEKRQGGGGRGGGGGSGRGGGGGSGSSRTKTRRARERKTETEPQTSQDTPPLAPVSRRQVQSSIRDHFPVRRSGRKTKSEIEKEEFERMAQRLRHKDESGLEAVDVEGKGRGVVSSRSFSRGELLCEYSGELITTEEAKKREEKYSNDTSIGCYMYYFSHKNNKLCVDATADNGRKGRLLNHSRTAANVVTKLIEVDGRPYLCLVAGRDIAVGEQLEYDYGERDKTAMDSHPWLAT